MRPTCLTQTRPSRTHHIPSARVGARIGSTLLCVGSVMVPVGPTRLKCKSRIRDLRGFVSKCTVNVQPGHVKKQTNCRHLLCWIVLDTRLSALTVHILLVSFSAR